MVQEANREVVFEAKYGVVMENLKFEQKLIIMEIGHIVEILIVFYQIITNLDGICHCHIITVPFI